MGNFVKNLLDLGHYKPEKNPISVVYMLLQFLKVKVTRMTIQQMLANHPAYPSLLSLSDVLKDWHVDNVALQLESMNQLPELPLPFIAHFKTGNGSYVLVDKLSTNSITYWENEIKKSTNSWEDFQQKWSGSVLLAEANEGSGEHNFDANCRQEILNKLRLPFLTSALVFILLFTLFNFPKHYEPVDWILLTTKTIGLILSLMLSAKQFGNKSNLIDSLCNISIKANCNSVLNSPAAKLWGWLSWADVGLTYFTSGILSLIIIIIQPDLRPILYILSLFSFPYIIFSIYYQAKIAQTWCPLCLGVQGVLLTETLLVISYIDPLPTYFQPYALLAISFLIPSIVLVLITPVLNNLPKSQQEHDELIKLKRNRDLFWLLLSKQSSMPMMSNDLDPILLGNAEAEYTITLITNPFCHPCSVVHKELKLLLMYNENIKAKIVFLACDDRIMQMATHLLTLSKTKDISMILSNWFEQSEKVYETWTNLNPVESDLTSGFLAAARQCDWCRQADIYSTPTLFVNGRKLPDLYSLSELRWILEPNNELDIVL